jgi:thiosulfate/3-mercaptopyruvate sulfurtransferase
MSAGHIPGSINTPFVNLIDPQTGLMKQPQDLQKIFGGIDTKKPIAISCGSGVTACVVALGLHLTGHENAAVYGGSWAEWGANPALPKKTGSNT